MSKINPIKKGKLIEDIYFSMQTTYTYTRIIRTYKEFGVETISEKTYSEEELKELLWESDSEILLKIADCLGLSLLPYLEDEETLIEDDNQKQQQQKIYISHSEEDTEIIADFIQILKAIGISKDAIFCDSIEGHGTALGSDRLKGTEDRLNEKSLVFFILSEHFYNSKMCLIEMGNVWGQSKDHISVAIPPFDLKQMEGVFQNYKGISIHLPKKLDALKKTLETRFDLKPKEHTEWEYMRDMALNSIRSKLPKDSV